MEAGGELRLQEGLAPSIPVILTFCLKTMAALVVGAVGNHIPK